MNTTRFLVSSASALVLAASVAAPALADTDANANVIMQVHAGSAVSGVRANVSATGGNVVMTAHPTVSVSIDDRITSLKNALARIGSLGMISSSAQVNVKAAIQAQIDKLEALKASGATTTSGPAVSSSAGTGVYLSVMSKAAVTTAGDHLLTVAGQLEKLSVKLKARIDASGLSTTDSLNATLSDMNAKVADAKVQANAALSDVADLSADADASSDTSVRASLKDAAAKIQAAHADVDAAYKDAQTIILAVKGTGNVTPSASTHANVSGAANAQ